jgi:hypothetical protein
MVARARLQFLLQAPGVLAAILSGDTLIENVL